MKFLGISFVVTLVVGGVFGWLAANSTEDGPLMFSFLGFIVVSVILTVLLFKYVGEMIGEQAPTTD
jgi:uncharacterized membrane protein YeaQ/YmgE (transglycosylase-associated protein family)